MSSSTEGDGVHGEASPLTATHGRSVSFSLCEGGAAARGGSVRAPSLAGHGARRHDAILGTAFNQDASCFAVWHESGFAVFAAEPFKEILRREYGDGGIGHVALYNRSNLLAIVGGGRNPKYSSNKVILLDEREGSVFAELEFRSDVKRVLLRQERLIVVLAARIHVFSLPSGGGGGGEAIARLFTFDTFDGSAGGACDACCSEHATTIVFPATARQGHISVAQVRGDSRRSFIIAAHSHAVSCVAVDRQGSMVATASTKGTLVRIFDLAKGGLLCEMRRGAEGAAINHISFSDDSSRLCMTSDKGTVHIFKIAAGAGSAQQHAAIPRELPMASSEGCLAAAEFRHCDVEGREARPGRSTGRRSSLSMVRGMLPKYFTSHRSFAQCHTAGSACIAAFGRDANTIICVTMDGSFHLYKFDPINGGECTREFSSTFLGVISAPPCD